MFHSNDFNMDHHRYSTVFVTGKKNKDSSTYLYTYQTEVMGSRRFIFLYSFTYDTVRMICDTATASRTEFTRHIILHALKTHAYSTYVQYCTSIVCLQRSILHSSFWKTRRLIASKILHEQQTSTNTLNGTEARPMPLRMVFWRGHPRPQESPLPCRENFQHFP